MGRAMQNGSDVMTESATTILQYQLSKSMLLLLSVFGLCMCTILTRLGRCLMSCIFTIFRFKAGHVHIIAGENPGRQGNPDISIQSGFAFLECGACRSRNAMASVYKVMVTSAISCVCYWAVGYTLAYTEGNAFLGYSGSWFLMDFPMTDYGEWLFQAIYAITATNIALGAMAERGRLVGPFMLSLLISGFVYPLVVHWTWMPSGWLSSGEGGNGYRDCAGAGVLHVLGGTAACAGACILGPRRDRFDKVSRNVKDVNWHSAPLMALGGFMLMSLFLVLHIGRCILLFPLKEAGVASLCLVNTLVAGSAGVIVSLLTRKLRVLCGNKTVPICFRYGKVSLLNCINSGLAGMVAVSAGCNEYYPWFSFAIGAVSGLVYQLLSGLLILIRLDDPVDAVSVHAISGMLGLVFPPLFSFETGIVFTGNKEVLQTLAWNMAGAGAIILWTSVACFLLFGTLRLLGLFKMRRDQENAGLDLIEHGAFAYPQEAWDYTLESKHSQVLTESEVFDNDTTLEDDERMRHIVDVVDRHGLSPNEG